MANIQADITIDVSPASGGQPLAVDVSGIPDVATVGVPYSGEAVASGGTPPYTFSATGDVPDGLTLDPNEGTLTGTPAADSAGSDSFVLTVTDSAGAVASQAVKRPANRAVAKK